jgi:nucleoside-diphosphate-sugar epimerase
MEKKILILASTSFIGKNIKKYFEKKYTISCINRSDGDFKNQNTLRTLIENVDPEIVINCCGIVGSSVKNENYSDYDILNENIFLNNNILTACKDLNIKKIIMFSSYRLFGDTIHENYDENDIQKSNIEYNVGYLTSKKVLDTQIKLFIKEYKITIVCLLLTNIFGSYDDFSINGRIVPSMIANIKTHLKNNTNMIVTSNKNTMVNLVYVEDIAKIVELSMLHEEIKGNVIVFNPKGIITLESLINKITTIMKFKNNILFENKDTIKKTNIMKPNMNSFYRFFGDFEFMDIEKGLETTIDFVNLLECE